MTDEKAYKKIKGINHRLDRMEMFKENTKDQFKAVAADVEKITDQLKTDDADIRELFDKYDNLVKAVNKNTKIHRSRLDSHGGWIAVGVVFGVIGGLMLISQNNTIERQEARIRSLEEDNEEFYKKLVLLQDKQYSAEAEKEE